MNCQLITQNQLWFFGAYPEIDRTGINPAVWTKNGRFLFIITLSHALIGVEVFLGETCDENREIRGNRCGTDI